MTLKIMSEVSGESAEGIQEVACTCARLSVGLTITNDRDWRPDCPEHGKGTSYYREIFLPQQARQNARIDELRRMKAERRKNESTELH